MISFEDSKVSTTPYWHMDVNFEDSHYISGLDDLKDQQEVLIVGAGYTGLSAALTLARAGKQVTVIDSHFIGFGASSRNGGLLGPSFHKLGLSGLVKRYGQETAQALLKESLAGFDWLINFIETEKIACDLQHCGRFRGALSIKKYDKMATQAQSVAATLDYPVKLVPRSEQHNEVGTDRYHGGVLYEKDACLHPAKLVNGLIAKLHAAGVTLVSQAALTQLKASGQGYTATINDREFKIAKVLIATNGYTTDTTANLKKRIIPIRSTMIATEAISAQMMASVSPKLHTHGGADRLVFYCRPSPDGTRLLFGGRALDSIDKPSEYTAFLHKNMLHLFPQLAHVKLANTWSGLVAYSFDHVPHLGEMDGIYYAMGHCGSGVARANYLGHKIALKMLGKDGSSVFDQFEFPSQLFYNANPWFMPAIIRWHNLADKLGL